MIFCSILKFQIFNNKVNMHGNLFIIEADFPTSNHRSFMLLLSQNLKYGSRRPYYLFLFIGSVFFVFCSNDSPNIYKYILQVELCVILYQMY